MRTFYIALIFVGCLSLALGQQAPFARVPKATAAPCVTAGANVTGCTQCITNPDPLTVETIGVSCNATAAGYYIDGTSLQAKNCPIACTECKAAAAKADPPICTVCQDTNGFVKYVDASTTSGCILCKDGFTFDNGNTNATQATKQDGICIAVDKSGQYSCVDTHTWDSLPNPSRKCVIKTTGTCQAGFSPDGNLTVANPNCSSCIKDYSIVTSQATNGNAIQYYTYSCLKTGAAPARVPAANCTAGTPVAGCKTCAAANNCTEALPGYYLVPTPTRLRNLASNAVTYTGQVLACPLSCATCAESGKCLTCPDGAPVSGTGVCDCSAAGYTTSILKSLATGPSVSYSCVNQANNDVCSSGYTWNSAAVVPTITGLCIDIYNAATTNTCYQDTGVSATSPAPLTSFWNSAPNPSRKCVLATSKSCLTNYAQKQGDANSTYQADLTGNCVACVGSLTLKTSEATNQVCEAASSSSILAMSIAFLGLLLALVF